MSHYMVNLIPIGLCPNCLHTTLASISSKKSLHMAPHVPLEQISTLPTKSEYELYGTSCISPSVQSI